MFIKKSFDMKDKILTLILLVFYLCSFGQDKTLNQIQNEIIVLNADFSNHYNKVRDSYKAINEKENEELKKIKSLKGQKLDSLKVVKSKLTDKFENGKVQYSNYLLLNKIVEDLNKRVRGGYKFPLNNPNDFKEFFKKYQEKYGKYNGKLQDYFLDEAGGCYALLVEDPKEQNRLDKIFEEHFSLRIIVCSFSMFDLKERGLFVINIDTLNVANFKICGTITFESEFPLCNTSLINEKQFKEVSDLLMRADFENQILEYSHNLPHLKSLETERLMYYTSSTAFVEAKKSIDRVDNEINQFTVSVSNQINEIETKLRKYNLFDFAKKRTSDSLELKRLNQYYFVEYPSALDDYNTKLAQALKNDKFENDQYEKKLVSYDSVNNMVQTLEFMILENAIKEQLTDPYSAKFVSYERVKLPNTNERFPCVHVLDIGVNSKNEYGGYTGVKYYTGIFIGGEMFGSVSGPKGKSSSFETDFVLNMDVAWRSTGLPNCDDSWRPPIKYTNSASLLLKPILKQTEFKLYN
jgi:hypothetical protein